MKTWYRHNKKISPRKYSNQWKLLVKKSEYSISFKITSSFDKPNISDELIEYYYNGIFIFELFFRSEEDMILYKLKYGI